MQGIHLIRHAVYRTAELGGQFVLLGSGHADGDFRCLVGRFTMQHRRPVLSLDDLCSGPLPCSRAGAQPVLCCAGRWRSRTSRTAKTSG